MVNKVLDSCSRPKKQWGFLENPFHPCEIGNMPVVFQKDGVWTTFSPDLNKMDKMFKHDSTYQFIKAKFFPPSKLPLIRDLPGYREFFKREECREYEAVKKV